MPVAPGPGSPRTGGYPLGGSWGRDLDFETWDTTNLFPIPYSLFPIHVSPPPADKTTIGPNHHSRPGRRGTLRSMQSAAQFQPQTPVSGLALVELGSPHAYQVVGVSAAWRKLLMQAEMAAPHVQVAS